MLYRPILVFVASLLTLSAPAVEVTEAGLPSEPRQLPPDGAPPSWQITGAASLWQGPNAELELAPKARAESHFTLLRPADDVFEGKGANGFQLLLSGEVLGESGAAARLEWLDGSRVVASVETVANQAAGGLRYRCDSVQPGAGFAKIFSP